MSHLKPAKMIDAVNPSAPPRISVVIALYNHEQYIEAAIRSVLSQTLPAAEIIVIDDGSTDGSAQKMQQICKSHPEIIFWSWPNQGAHHTLNAGILRATGEFVAILNSDDCYSPQRLATCVEVMQSHPDVDVVATKVTFIDGQNKKISNPWYDEALTFYQRTSDMAPALFHANFLVTTSNLFIRRSVFESIGLFSPLRYTHDLDFFFRVILGRRSIHFLEQPLLDYRLHNANTISQDKTRQEIERAAVLAFFLFREWRSEGGQGPLRNTLQNYVDALGQHGTLEIIQEFLSVLELPQQSHTASTVDPLASHFLAFLAELGVDWVGADNTESLLSRFQSASQSFSCKQHHEDEKRKLQTDIHWLIQQRGAWEKKAAEHVKTIETQQAQMEELLSSNAWLFSQQQALAHTVAADQARMQELIAANEELNTAKAWLASQRQAWEQTAIQRDLSIFSLQAHAQELLAGNAWLASQRQAWEQATAERDLAVAVLRRQLQETTQDLTKANVTLSKIRSHLGMRCINYFSKKQLFS